METTKIVGAEEVKREQLLLALKVQNDKLKADLDYVVMRTGLTLNEEDDYVRQIPQS